MRGAGTGPGDARALGDCPDCETSLRRAHLLIEYETTDGREAFAACPRCDRVVHPR